MQYKKIVIKEKNKNNVTSSTKDSLLNELLRLRDLTEEKDINLFLNPSKKDFVSPYAFSDMEKAKSRINEAIDKKQKILVWGDFDCDGVTSTSILYKALKYLNADVMTFIPDRLLHGHGLNSKELLKFVAKEHVKVVITVDCGISNISEVNLLKGLNVDVIITDHHASDGEIPNAYCIINPQVKDSIKSETSAYDIVSLASNSGSAISYKLAMALLDNSSCDDLKDELHVISACGIVADVVPLIQENRAMVYTALEILNLKKEKAHKGIYKLLSNNSEKNITSTDIAFMLAPRINAVGRLSNASLALEFLTEDSELKLNTIIEKLDNYNKIRQAKCEETYNEIKNSIEKDKKEQNNSAVILINKDWHIGVIGIVASKIVEEYDKPCFLMTIDENNNARCSIRSNESINVYNVLKENEELFSSFGGHAFAGGFSFNLDSMPFEKVKSAILKTVDSETEDKKENNFIYADVELAPDDIEINIMDTINSLEPYGEANKEPLFVMRDVYVSEIKTIGKENNHLSFTFEKDGKKFRGLRWGENSCEIIQGQKCDVAFYLRLNSFNGTQSIQFDVYDIYSPELKIETKKVKVFDHRYKTDILKNVISYLKKDNLDIGVWAKSPATKQMLETVKNRFVQNNEKHKELMFFDYPSSIEDLTEIVNEVKPVQVHMMNYKIDENLENYIRQINGMIKYCANKLDGSVDIKRLSRALSVSENFIQITLEIMEDINSIKILDIDKIEYIKSFDYEKFRENSMFEVLQEEFQKINEFKMSLLKCGKKELEEIFN